jgi:hypothetical protein
MPPPAADDRRPALQPPRFRLRTLLAIVGGCCILLAILPSLNFYAMFATIMFVLSVIAHFMGAMIGHRLRDHGSQVATGQSIRERYPHVDVAQFPPATRLSRRRGPGRLIVIMTIAWSLVGAVGGAALLMVLNGERASVVNVTSGALAFAVLGAIWGFALAAFLQEMLSALWEAHKVK